LVIEVKFWINGVSFDSCVVGDELPVGSFGVVVSPGCPCGDLSADFVDVADASAQALFRQYTQFTFRTYSISLYAKKHYNQLPRTGV